LPLLRQNNAVAFCNAKVAVALLLFTQANLLIQNNFEI